MTATATAPTMLTIPTVPTVPIIPAVAPARTSSSRPTAAPVVRPSVPRASHPTRRFRGARRQRVAAVVPVTDLRLYP